MKYLTIFFLTIIIFNILLTSYEKPAKKSLKKNRDNSVLQKKTKKNNVKKNKKKSKKRKNKKINSFRTIRPEPLYRVQFKNPYLRG